MCCRCGCGRFDQQPSGARGLKRWSKFLASLVRMISGDPGAMSKGERSETTSENIKGITAGGEIRPSATRLEVVGFLGVGETGKSLRRAALIDFNLYGALGFGTGLAEQGESCDSFVVNLSNQIRFAGIIFLPDLANLDLSNRHSTNVDRFEEGVNKGATVRFAGPTSTPF